MADNSSRKFKFISPGVYVNEIDNSQLPAQPGDVGPLIIGRSRKGPADKPVEVSSFSDFVQTFGEPSAGNEGSDIWREGDSTAPTYAAYAAQAWLKNNSPVTFMRVLGDEHPQATAAGKAGWKVPDAGRDVAASPAEIVAMNAQGGAYALCVWPQVTAPSVSNGVVAAQFYVTGSGRILLSGTLASTSAAAQCGSALFELSSLSNIPLVFTGSLADSNVGGKKVTVSLNPDDENFIRKALNTNPTITNGDITDSSTQAFYQGGNYWLGESFERSGVEAAANGVGLLGPGNGNGYYAAIVPMAIPGDFGSQQSNFENAATRASTGWFISQDLTNDFADYAARNMQQLFRFEALSAGEAAQRQVKISISNIKAPTGDYQTHGTFSVLVRDLADSDNRQIILERFDNLSLNPAASNYIAAAIGDKYEIYDSSEQRLVEYGEFPSRSNYIRVVMNDDVAAGAGESRWLPFGVFGPLKYRDVGYESGSIGWSENLAAPASQPVIGGVKTMLRGGQSADLGNVGHPVASDDMLDVPLHRASTTITVTAAGITKVDINNDTFDLTDAAGTPDTFTFNSGNDNTAAGTIGIASAVDGDAAYFASQLAQSINDSGLLMAATVTTAGGPGVDAVVQVIQDGGTVSGNTVVDLSGVDNVAGDDFAGGGIFEASLAFPSAPLRTSSTWGTPNSLKSTFWGTWTGRASGNVTFNEDILDSLRVRSMDAGGASDPASTTHDVAGETTTLITSDAAEIAWVFSLDNISGSAADGYTHGRTLRSLGTSLTAPVDASYRTALDAGIDRFTTVLHGGSDGYDITEREPFRNTKFAAATDEKASYELYSLRKAVNIAGDADRVQMNVVTMPGITAPQVTSFLLDAIELRGDALAIIDIESAYTPSAEATGDQQTRNAANTPTAAATAIAGRSINNSYGAAYYPWVRILDTNSNRNLWVPPSVAAMGVLSTTDRVQAPWFAPAGFTRGGLSEGAAGLPVLDVSRRLTSDERDELYENNINPIAKFPAEGIVIFGQKTLQQTASALDRINVRRLMIYLKREISFIASRLLFGPNTQDTWDRFLGQAGPLLESVRAEYGIEDFRLVLDETTTTPDLIDRNIIYAKLLVKPTRSVEYFAIDFVVTNSGASFED